MLSDSDILWDKATNADALVCSTVKSDANRPSDKVVCEFGYFVCVCVCVCDVCSPAYDILCASSL